MRNFVREKKIYCGHEYLEVDCFNYTKSEEENSRKGQRSKKEVLSTPTQIYWNDENSKRRFLQIANTNFGEGDIHIAASYSPQYLPPTIKDILRDGRNYMRRIEYRRRKEGLTPLKYMLIASTKNKDGETEARPHLHIIMNGGLDRDMIEAMWAKDRVNWKRWKIDKKYRKKIKQIGRCNAKNLQIEANENGLATLCGYLENQTGGTKRWISSHNLDKPEKETVDPDSNPRTTTVHLSTSSNLEHPWSRTNDHSFSRKELEKIAKNPPDSSYWERRYPGYTLIGGEYGFKAVYSDTRGWAIYLKLRRIKR